MTSISFSTVVAILLILIGLRTSRCHNTNDSDLCDSSFCFTTDNIQVGSIIYKKPFTQYGPSVDTVLRMLSSHRQRTDLDLANMYTLLGLSHLDEHLLDKQEQEKILPQDDDEVWPFSIPMIRLLENRRKLQPFIDSSSSSSSFVVAVDTETLHCAIGAFLEALIFYGKELDYHINNSGATSHTTTTTNTTATTTTNTTNLKETKGESSNNMTESIDEITIQIGIVSFCLAEAYHRSALPSSFSVVRNSNGNLDQALLYYRSTEKIYNNWLLSKSRNKSSDTAIIEVSWANVLVRISVLQVSQEEQRQNQDTSYKIGDEKDSIFSNAILDCYSKLNDAINIYRRKTSTVCRKHDGDGEDCYYYKEMLANILKFRRNSLNSKMLQLLRSDPDDTSIDTNTRGKAPNPARKRATAAIHCRGSEKMILVITILINILVIVRLLITAKLGRANVVKLKQD